MTETDKQSAILAATLDLIAEQGFHNTPVSQIAKRSGVSAGIIYHYFENKEDVIHALYRQIKQKLSESLIAGNPHLLAWPENMKRLWVNFFYFYLHHPKETLVMEQYNNSPYARQYKADMEDENAQFLATMIEETLQKGLLRQMPETVMYELSFGVALGLAKRQIAGEIVLSEADLEEVAEACLRAIAKT